MTRVALSSLRPGDEVVDLVAAGTVETVAPLRRRDGRPVDAVRVDLTNGLVIAGPAAWEVATRRELVDA